MAIALYELRSRPARGTLNPGADSINFDAAIGTPIELPPDLPAITQDLTITGPGATALSVDGNDLADRIFQANAGTRPFRSPA